MGYTEDDCDVRVDFFKEQGKWYTAEAVHWTGAYKGDPREGGQLIWDAFIVSLADQLAELKPGTDPAKPENYRVRYNSMWAVCLEPSHQHAHPLMMRVPDDLVLQAMAITGRPPKRYMRGQPSADEVLDLETASEAHKTAARNLEQARQQRWVEVASPLLGDVTDIQVEQRLPLRAQILTWVEEGQKRQQPLPHEHPDPFVIRELASYLQQRGYPLRKVEPEAPADNVVELHANERKAMEEMIDAAGGVNYDNVDLDLLDEVINHEDGPDRPDVDLDDCDDGGAGGYIEHDWMLGGPLVSDDDPEGEELENLLEEEGLPEHEHFLSLGRH